jgi:hypothetical protein
MNGKLTYSRTYLSFFIRSKHEPLPRARPGVAL